MRRRSSRASRVHLCVSPRPWPGSPQRRRCSAHQAPQERRLAQLVPPAEAPGVAETRLAVVEAAPVEAYRPQVLPVGRAQDHLRPAHRRHRRHRRHAGRRRARRRNRRRHQGRCRDRRPIRGWTRAPRHSPLPYRRPRSRTAARTRPPRPHNHRDPARRRSCGAANRRCAPLTMRCGRSRPYERRTCPAPVRTKKRTGT